MSESMRRARGTAASPSWWVSGTDTRYRRRHHVLLPLLPADIHSSSSLGQHTRQRQLELYLNLNGHRLTPVLTPQQVADIFRYGSIQDFVRWQKSMLLSSHVTIPPPPSPPAPAPSSGWTHDNVLNEYNTADVGRDTLKAGAFGSAVGAAVAAVAALLSLLLLARLADRCTGHTLHHLFSSRRRQSEEWPTPNVTATNLTTQVPEQTAPDESTACAAPPPPYWHCVELEPPPPYSECYVTFSNNEDTHTPTIHLHKELQFASNALETNIDETTYGFTQTCTQSDDDLVQTQQRDAVQTQQRDAVQTQQRDAVQTQQRDAVQTQQRNAVSDLDRTEPATTDTSTTICLRYSSNIV